MDISIEKLQLGDTQEFKGIFDRFYPALCAFANSYLNDTALATDVVQETFVKFWSQKRQFDNLFKIKSFLYTVVRNACLNKLRDIPGKRIGLEALDSQVFFKDNLIEKESYRIFYQAVNTLPTQMRRVIELALDDKKNAEIAEELGIRESSVLTLKKIAYQKLRHILQDYYYLIFIFLYNK